MKPLITAALCGLLGIAAALPAAAVRAADPPAPAAPPEHVTPGGKPETTEQRDARMAWWREAKFGMFIHWGVYAVPAGRYEGKEVPGIGEWIMLRAKIPVATYRDYAHQFNPVKYDPDAWAKLAQDAGMRYMVITSKHHDGFALFPSEASDWNVAKATPYGKDLIGPLAQSARKHGLHFGLYYSQAQDWNNPGGAKAGEWKNSTGWDPAQFGDFDHYLDTVAVPQVSEIVKWYRPDIIWFDTPVEMTPERAAKFLPVLATEPNLIINNRLGGGVKGDTDTPEQKIPATGIPGRDWETCMTINGTWGYKVDDLNFKPVSTLLHNLVDIVSKGGNYLLNVGPTAEGIIPAQEAERLEAVGVWMKTNGESIYGTTASPFPVLPWGRCTVKDRDSRHPTLYLHVFDWPADGRLLVPGLTSKVRKASLLAGGEKLQTEATPDGVLITLPHAAPDSIVSVVKLEVNGPVAVTLPPAPASARQATDGSVLLTAQSAAIQNPAGAEAKVEDRYGAPNIGFWTDPRTTITWRFHADQPGRYTVVADLATAAEGAKLAVVSGDSALTATAPATGSYETFQPVTLGTVTLVKAGDIDLLIRPDAANWKPINLRSVTLRPARD